MDTNRHLKVWFTKKTSLENTKGLNIGDYINLKFYIDVEYEQRRNEWL